jgi:hypothetical protein
VAAVVVPKCPACLAAYGSALAALGLGPIAGNRLVEALLAVTVLLSFGLVASLARRRGGLVAPVLSAAGVSLILAGRLAVGAVPLTLAGALLLVAAALANTVLCRRAARAAL